MSVPDIAQHTRRTIARVLPAGPELPVDHTLSQYRTSHSTRYRSSPWHPTLSQYPRQHTLSQYRAAAIPIPQSAQEARREIAAYAIG
eukprot:3940819-Rhodomonas_salina.1